MRPSHGQRALSSKWSGLNLNLLADIYGVHKAFLFGQSQRADYPLSRYIDNIETAERPHFGDDSCSTLIDENKMCFALSFYPLYLVNDSVFDIMSCHFAVSSVVNETSKKWESTEEFHIRSVVVPVAICSRYDTDDLHEPTFRSLERYLDKASSHNFHITRSINMGLANVSDIITILRSMIDLITHCKSSDDPKVNQIAIVFNGQRLENKPQTVTVFECSDFDELHELKMNYFISFDFHIAGIQNDAPSHNAKQRLVRCWLTFGVGQRLRWYPEYSVWIMPTLFVRSTEMTTYKVLKILYGEEYKHGWRVDLIDTEFNKYYHIITGYEHISNNYNRMEFKQQISVQELLRDELERKLADATVVLLTHHFEEQRYDSDAIIEDVIDDNKHFDADNSNIVNLMRKQNANLQELKFLILRFDNLECKEGAVHHIHDCEHIHTVIRNLMKFEDCDLEVDASTVFDFDLDAVINGFDHIINAHKFFTDFEKKRKIRNYVAERVKCQRGEDCPVLSRHSNRARERETVDEKKEEPLDEVTLLIM